MSTSTPGAAEEDASVCAKAIRRLFVSRNPVYGDSVTTTFIDRDADFERWRDNHADAYIVNHGRVPTAEYLVLHRASCAEAVGVRTLDQVDQSTPASIDGAPHISLGDMYAQALTSMRATDDISLRLLAAVPFVSGIGITLLARKPTEVFPAMPRLFISLFAAVVTLAIYRWERRNMSHCRRLRTWAAQVERTCFSELQAETRMALGAAPHDDNLSGKFFSRTWGKTQAELLLYMTVIVGWLATGLYSVVS